MKKLDSVSIVRFILVFAIFFSFEVSAQQAEVAEEEPETESDTTTVVSALDLVPEILEEQMDSPVSSFLLKDRLKYLQNEIPLRYNEYSHRYVDFFVDKRTSFTRRMLETKDLYFPIFEKALAENNLPDELKYLPLIESGLNPRIISRAGAGGLWQFMRATGREFGLQQNQFIDERFHPEKSTEAACKYLRQLHKIFGDWEMALAAYNCGPGNVRRAIRRTGKSDFWGIYPVLPKETRNYVPQFVAMVYLMNYSRDHGIVASDLKLTPVSDTLKVNGYLNLNTFASLGGMSLDDIYELNPHLVGTCIPQSEGGFCLMIPATKAALLADNMTSILDSSSRVPAGSGIHLAESRTVKDGYELISTNIRHTVRGGQTLSSIARQHGVTVSQLKAWNGMRSSMLRKGQRLLVKKTTRSRIREEAVQSPVVIASRDTSSQKANARPAAGSASGQAEELAVTQVPAASESEVSAAPESREAVQQEPGAPMTEAMLLARQAARMEARSKDENKDKTRGAVAVKQPVRKVETGGGSAVHTIAKGETLISIAERYNVEVEEIKKHNGLQSSKLVAGKKLEIPGNAEAVADHKPVAQARTRTRNVYHVVQTGDTLWAISRKYGLSVDKIKKVNNIKGNALKTGMKILISG
ncbi:MAG: hypothetical protein ABS46_17110 [Cytophagaceae bacterium SCN 52-12]|nr:MAG: hypothetical protein ABS46_17110 [Cytophagaceae bacterium SCN 52-12]